MFDFLEKLKSKPAHTRKAIAIGLAAALTGIFFFVWLLYWNSFSGYGHAGNGGSSDGAPETASAPGDLVKESIKDFGGALGGSISEIKRQFEF